MKRIALFLAVFVFGSAAACPALPDQDNNGTKAENQTGGINASATIPLTEFNAPPAEAGKSMRPDLPSGKMIGRPGDNETDALENRKDE